MFFRGAPRALPIRSPLQNFFPRLRFYSKKVRPENAPRIRYLVLMVLVSFGAMHLATSRITKKGPPKNSFSEREFQQYEQESGLKRRSKLVGHEQNSQYDFYVVPFTHDRKSLEQELAKRLPEDKQVKVVDPKELIEKELEDEGRYSYLLEDLKRLGKPLPRGLLTALVKQEVKLFMNTTRGQHDTSIVLVNYPQTTEEAIKFENEVADIKACLVFSDYDQSVSDLSDDEVRKVTNVLGYFDIVKKKKQIGSGTDKL